MNVRAVPLFLSFAVYPAAMRLSGAAGIDLGRNWIDALWFGLFAASLGAAATLGVRGDLFRARRLAGLLAIAGCCWWLRFGPPWLFGPVALRPWLMEAKPAAYLLVALAWCAAFGPPRRKEFVRAGALLGALVAVEFALSLALTGEAARPQGSGEINYDACLLVVALCMGLGLSGRGRMETAAIMAGLAASLSRTSLAAAAVVLVVYGGLGAGRAALAAAAAVALVAASFAVRGLAATGLEDLDRYWMFKSALELFATHPREALAGFAPGESLPASVPGWLGELWRDQSAGAGVVGVYAFHYHAMWLRLAVTWGLPAAGALFCWLAARSLSGGARGALAMAVILHGMTMGVAYLSNVAVVVMLAWVRVEQGESVLARGAATGGLARGEALRI